MMPFYPRILVPVDFSSCSEEAFRVALTLARVFHSAVTLLHVVDTRNLDALNRLGLALPSEEAGQKMRLKHYARAQLRRLVGLEEAKGLTIHRVVVEGAPFVEIARTVRTEKVSLVVMGSYGGQVGSVEKIFFGSTAEKVVRTAGCPVLTVPLPNRTRASSDETVSAGAP